MEKLQMCRICLVENVRMYVVINRDLHELYEKLTDIRFVTEDSRPILACFICCTKLKQCCRLLRQCLEAEEQFAQMMNEDYEPNPFKNQEHLEFFSGFNQSPIEYISIADECQIESITIKEELPAVCEGLNAIIEPREDHQSDELKPENADFSCLDVADIPPQHSESDLEDDVPLVELESQVVEEEVSKKKRRVKDSKKLKPANGDLRCLDVADIPPQQSESGLEDDVPLMEFKSQVVEEVSKKKRRVKGSKKLKPANVDFRCPDVADIPPQHSDSGLEDDVPLIEFKSQAVEEVSKKERRVTDSICTKNQGNINIEMRATIIELHKGGLNRTQIAEETGVNGRPLRRNRN